MEPQRLIVARGFIDQLYGLDTQIDNYPCRGSHAKYSAYYYSIDTHNLHSILEF
ncbi:MAG: hypothetical protein ACJAWL_002301 [Motiliproteus sp.]|jgi:hypothetical protein